MKQLSLALAVAGIAISTALVAWFGAEHVAGAALSVGFGGFGALIGWQLVLFCVLGCAWACLLPGAPLWLPVWGRMVRDAAGACLPFSQVGGYVFGARAATLHGLPWQRAAASTVVDVTAEFLAQMVFAAYGVAMLVWREPGSALVWPAAIGLGAAVAGAGGFIVLQRGATPLVRFLAGKIVGDRFGDTGIDMLTGELAAIYRRPGRLALGIGFHTAAWVCSGVASWIGYRLLGVPIDLVSALAIEALLTAALSLAFAIPGYAGVQEAAFAGLGSVYGLPLDLSLSASILRRARELAVGLPILVVWQAIEARRLRAARPARTG